MLRNKEASFEEVHDIVLPRNKIEMWLDEPFRDKALQGALVRVI